MIASLLHILLRRSPRVDFTNSEVIQYEALRSSLHHEGFQYDLAFPKYRFLQYLASKEPIVFHGSNHANIQEFEPREQTLFNGELTKAVFATADPTWAIFYAVFDRSKLVRSFRNGCMVFRGRNYHYYSLNQSTMKRNPWTEGVLYILPKGPFRRSDQKAISFDEWTSPEHVKPIGRIKVSVEDFYFRDQVATHQDHESLLKTWLLYKIRSRRG